MNRIIGFYKNKKNFNCMKHCTYSAPHPVSFMIGIAHDLNNWQAS